MINNLLIRLATFTMQKTLISGLVMGVLYYFAMFNDGSSIEQQITATQALIQQEEGRAKESDAALKEVEQVRATVGTLSDQFKLVSQALPSEVQMSDVIRAVDSTSRASGVSVKTKEPRPVINHEYYEEIPLRVTMEGSYSEITMFLYYMASQERIMKVRNFMVSIPGNNEKISPGRLLFDGEVLSFRFVGEKKEPKK